MSRITDIEKLVAKINKFVAFARSQDGDRPISFVDKNTFLGREENYKAEIAERARKELSYESWQVSMINTGEIIECCKKAKKFAGNLIYINQQYHFDNVVSKNHKNYNVYAEQALYDIYKSKDEKTAFEQATKVFGKKYDLIAYLFFIKDSSRFLPVSPKNFDNSLKSLGINYQLSYNCSWENYIDYLKIVREIQEILQDMLLDVDVRLIDAHSFLWVINEKKFLEWKPDKETSLEIEGAAENYITSKVTGERRIMSYFARSADVVKATKVKANGICQLCGKPAPFNDKNGNPYLETHHVKWLSRGGEDSLNNTVALCPNCHTRMHILDDEADVEKLLRSINDN